MKINVETNESNFIKPHSRHKEHKADDFVECQFVLLLVPMTDTGIWVMSQLYLYR